MIRQDERVTECSLGFTLVETIVYIALFGLLFSGVFVSVYPILTGAERLTRTAVVEGETAFILAKLRYALAHTITSPDGVVVTPEPGATAHELVIAVESNEQYRFAIDSSLAFCTPPLVCSVLTLSRDGGEPQPLHTSRVNIEEFRVTHTPPGADGTPRSLTISFTADGEPVVPVRYYLHF